MFKILKKENLAPNIYLMDVEAPRVARNALPGQFPTGSFRGLRARGGVTVDAAWKDGRVIEARLKADRDACFTLRMNGQDRDVQMKAGETLAI